MMGSYRGLVVWQKAMDLTVEIYALIKQLPKIETYSLADQMKRAAVSIPSNIAEGQERSSKKEFANFLTIARGSRAELETQLLICVRIGYLTETDIEKSMNLLDEIGKILSTLITNLKVQNQ